jgi:hypothetical protein
MANVLTTGALLSAPTKNPRFSHDCCVLRSKPVSDTRTSWSSSTLPSRGKNLRMTRSVKSSGCFLKRANSDDPHHYHARDKARSRLARNPAPSSHTSGPDRVVPRWLTFRPKPRPCGFKSGSDRIGRSVSARGTLRIGGWRFSSERSFRHVGPDHKAFRPSQDASRSNAQTDGPVALDLRLEFRHRGRDLRGVHRGRAAKFQALMIARRIPVPSAIAQP